MSADEYYKAGRLKEAIAAQIQEVKAHPADQARRLFLFELLAFAGELDRARRQIDALRYPEPDLQTAADGYRKLLDAEEARRQLFSDGVKPRFLVEPPAHVALRLEAINRLRANQPAEAAELLTQAAGKTPTLTGQLNGKPFQDLRDADDVFGTVVEVLARGQYFWVPLEQIDSLAMNPPTFPRDLLWFPANLEMAGALGEVFLPALYPNSHLHADEQIQLGRATDWKSAEGGPVQGVGLRTFLVDEDALALLEWRELLIAEGS
jgi:type VI secretion system protein ImpE